MDLVAKEIMRRSVERVPPDMLLSELQRQFVELNVMGFAVVEDEKVVGVVSRSDVISRLYFEREAATQTSDYYRDASGFHEVATHSSKEVADRIGERMEQLTVREVMHPNVFAVGPDQPLRAVAEILVDNNIHRVLVIHEGQLLGIITPMDFVRLYATGRIKPDYAVGKE